MQRKHLTKIEHPSMWAILNKFGFGPRFMSMLRILYTDSSRVVVNSGYFTSPFGTCWGTAQGCPWSPFAFALCIEPVGAAIRQNKQIKGVSLNGAEKKAAQYADDLWACILAEESSLATLLGEIKDYTGFTGLKMNYDKSNVLRIGPLAHTEFKIKTEEPLNWTSDRIRVLGVWIALPSHHLYSQLQRSVIKNKSKAKSLDRPSAVSNW